MAKSGVVMGYDDAGTPWSAAMYGPEIGVSLRQARSDAGAGGLNLREFPEGDPRLEAEMSRWRDVVASKAMEGQSDG
jgi:hypothetical protein